jgi:hypothetical protein
MSEIKYPDRYDEGIYGMCMEESAQGNWVACSYIADYPIDVMSKSSNDAEKMKITVKVEKEVEIKTVMINISPRYIGDDADDDMATNFPLLNEQKTAWIAKVDVDNGVIENWPAGDAREMHVKVCDSGTYRLIDVDGNEVAAIVNGYVPNGLIPGSYGDYVELTIDETGRITNWPKYPAFSEFFDD